MSQPNINMTLTQLVVLLSFKRQALENEIKLNIEVNHATLSGHNFEHEIAYAISNNVHW